MDISLEGIITSHRNAAQEYTPSHDIITAIANITSHCSNCMPVS